MKYHTLLLGTSKTVFGEAYFCKGKNIERFWGTLSQIHGIFSGKEQTAMLNLSGVLLKDISSAEGGEEKRDSQIKAISLKRGFVELENFFNENTALQRIGFVGKQSAKWFFIHFIKQMILNKVESKVLNSELFEYGKQEWKFCHKNNKITCHILTNTTRQWKPEIRKQFWWETAMDNRK
jgi:hypothetical protein